MGVKRDLIRGGDDESEEYLLFVKRALPSSQ